MAKKTSTKTPSQTRTAAASKTGKPGKPGKPGNKASVGAAFAKRTASSITGDIRFLAAEVKDLRSLRAKYDQLLAEHHGLVGALRELSTELAGSARSAWKQYRAGGKSGKGSMTSSSTLMGRPRVRAASAEVDAMTAKLLASLPTAWSTKQEVCRAAGLDPTEANSAFRRLVLGYTRGGKKVHPAIETNGKRGIEGRYRKA